MDRRAAGALLALAACIACSAAAPTASNHTALDLYEGASEGCYYNFQHYGEGDRIMTNEPCLNCTCHNRMLMCYLRVCPFTKPIGQDCTVEKRADQCCPIVTCPDVPVDLLTSTSTTSPAEYGATGLGKLDKYGCSINGKYFPEGSKVPPTPNKPCEHCYCIRNMTTCVMQECTLHVDGCTPIYHKDVCCPIRYSCDHPEDEVPLLDDMSTTVRPTPGFLLTTTTLSPVTQMSQDCVHNDQVIPDGASITTEKACEHCYCMKGDIVCVVQECGAPMENEGKNCTSLPPREGQCCPDTYICEGDELIMEVPNEGTTDLTLELLTTLSPPRRTGVEGSGYRHEPNEAAYTAMPSTESEIEGSGDELEPSKSLEGHEAVTPGKPIETDEITPGLEDGDQYIPVTTKAPAYEQSEATTKRIDKNLIPDVLDKETVEPEIYPTSNIPEEDNRDMATGVTEEINLPHEHVTLASTSIPESNEYTTESIESLNTVPDIKSPEKEHEMPHEYSTITTEAPSIDEIKPATTLGLEGNKSTQSTLTGEPEYNTQNPEVLNEIDRKTTEKAILIPEQITEKSVTEPESDRSGITSAPAIEEIRTLSPEEHETVTTGAIANEKDIPMPEQSIPTTTSAPLQDIDKLTTELNNAQNTVIVAEEESHYPHVTTSENTEKSITPDFEGIDKTTNVDELEPEEHATTIASVLKESESTAEPDKGLNTIPSEIDEQSNTQPSLMEVTTSSAEIKTTESPIHVDKTQPQDIVKSPITSEPSTLVPETHVTKVDQYTITTEPSFRKEDDAGISTEKPKEEYRPTTIKAEFVDEGLIPTSTHDEKTSTGPDFPSTDEDITTMIPEYNKEPEETVASQQSTTEAILETSVAAESLPEKVSETSSELEGTLSPSTEKSADVTTLLPTVDTHEEPSRIPGEGDCLLNGVTYRNNTTVPSTNNCHTGCKCVSSIIKCDPIICSPPPDYMSNCQSIYDTPDSCCPTYICDHPRETIPPQSDNQMSGTEPPIIKPTIECRGDQCELSVPTKPTEPSALCTSGNCLPADKTDQCGPEGCGEFVKEPVSVQPSHGESGCSDGKCEPSAEDCSNGKCQSLPTHSQPSPIKPCTGDDCKIIGEETPISQLCENGQDCEKIKHPTIQAVPDVSCGSDGCDSSVVSPTHESPTDVSKEGTPPDCTGNEPCRRKEFTPTEELPHECEGSDCVQKTDTSVEQDIPQHSTVSPLEEASPFNEVTDKLEPVGEEKVPEQVYTSISEKEIEVTTPISQLITEHLPMDYTTLKTTDTEMKPAKVPEKTSESPDILTEEPTLYEKESTKNPSILEEYTNTPISVEDITTQKPHIIQSTEDISELIEDQGTQTPDVVKEEHTDKTPSVEEQQTVIPIKEGEHQIDNQQTPTEEEVTKTSDITEEYTHKQTLTEEEVTKAPEIIEEYTHKSTDVSDIVKEHTDEFTVLEESGTKASKISDVTKEYFDISTQRPDTEKDHSEPSSIDSATKVIDIVEHTKEPISISEEGTKSPDQEIKYTDMSHLTEDEKTEAPSVADKEPIPKSTPVEEESTSIPHVTKGYSETPDLVKEHTDESTLIGESSTKVPDVTEKQTNEPIYITEKATKSPDYGNEYTDKPSHEEQYTMTPDIAKKDEQVNKLTPSEEEVSRMPTVTEEYDDKLTEMPYDIKDHSDKAPPVDIFGTKKPDGVEEQGYVPVIITEQGTESPDYGVDRSDKPILITDQDSEIPNATEKESEDKLTPVVEETTKRLDIIDEQTEEPTKASDIEKEPTDKATTIPELIKEQIDESTKVPELDTTLSHDREEDTQVPVVIAEEGTGKPHYEEDHTDKTLAFEENEIKTPHDLIAETVSGEKEKPTTEEIPTESPDLKDTVEKKPDFTEIEGTTESISLDDSGTESQETTKDSTKKPLLIDESKLYEMEGSTDKVPIMTEESNTAKDNLSINEEPTKRPEFVKDDHKPEIDRTGEPEISQGHEHVSQTPDEEESGTKIPETYVTESEVDVKLPESSTDEHIKPTDIELEKATRRPAYESETTETDTGMPIEPQLVTVDTSKTHEITGLEYSTKEPQDGTGLPLDVTMETVTKEEQVTEITPVVTISQDILPPLQEGEQTTYEPSKHITPSQESLTGEHGADETPAIVMTTESIEKATKSTEHEITSDHKAGYTGIPEQESELSTKSPVEIVMEPQGGEQPESPEVTKTGHVDEETTTKLFKEDEIKHTASESPVTEHEDITRTPEIIRVTEVTDLETQTTRLPDSQEGELENVSTKAPTKDVLKTDQPEIYTPEKEEMITSSIDTTGTEPPMKLVTEIEDALSTGKEPIPTEYNEEPTERFESPTTIKAYDSSEEIASSIKTTKGPEEFHSEPQAGYTEAPVLKETKPTETDIIPTISHETLESDKLVPEEPHKPTETTDGDKPTSEISEMAHTTQLPEQLVTEFASEEKTTKSPYSYPHTYSDVTTEPPEMYVTSKITATAIPESHESVSGEVEPSKTTESTYVEPQVTDDQGTVTKVEEPVIVDTQKLTTIPELSIKPESDTLGPATEPEMQKLSTESTPTFVEIRTDLPHTQITTEAALSLVTEHKPDSVIPIEKHDYTEAPVPESQTEVQDQTTEREDVTTKRVESTKPADKTSAEVEFSETTPYLIELEEHTHKIIEEPSTVSSVIESGPTYVTDEVITTSSPSKDDHTPVREIVTPAPTEEEHTFKIDYHIPTVSTSDENVTPKIPEDTSAASPSLGEATETGQYDLEKITEKIPEGDLEIATTIPSGSSETPSSISGEVSQTTLSETKEAEIVTKPTQEPAAGEPIDRTGITTSKPSQDFDKTTASILTDTEKSPIYESDIKVPTKEQPSIPHEYDTSDKSTPPAEESTFSTTKPTTVKQEEFLTPTPEDKYSHSEEKPTNVPHAPSHTVEVPKPPAEVEPTEEIPPPEEDGLSPGVSGYGEPDYAEEDQAFGPGTCRYGGKVYVSAQQIPRDDPCDFCFCFRSDIICLQQSCPPPIHGCHEEPIQGFCCPRYECPVSMATTVNVTTTTTTTTTTLPPHFPTHGYKGAAQRRGCQIKGHTYKVGEVVRSSSGPCLHCTCGGDGQMKCDPKACTPEPMLRQMIAAAVSAKRRR